MKTYTQSSFLTLPISKERGFKALIDKYRFKLSRNSTKLIFLTLLTVILTLLCLPACSTFSSENQSNFHLKVFEEAESLSVNDNQKKIITSFTSPSGIFDKDSSSGEYSYLKYAFLLPGTITAEQTPEYVTYRSKQNNITISEPIDLRYENGLKELSLPWEEASNYPQIWIIIELNKEQLSNLKANPDRPTELEYCVKQFENSFLEIEAIYKNGVSSKKLYSINPGKKNEFGIEYVIMTEKEVSSE